MNYLIKHAEPEDITELIQFHLISFPSFFSSCLGDKFLKIYYRSYQLTDEHLILVAKTQDKIIGFIAGTTNADLLYQSLFRKNFFSLVKLTFKRFLFSKNFRNKVFKKNHFLIQAINSQFLTVKKLNPRKKSKQAPLVSNYAHLFLIAVREEFRGKGVSLDLISEFEKEMRKKGILKCTLWVKSDNLRAIGFYKKTGWEAFIETEEAIKFIKDLSKNLT